MIHRRRAKPLLGTLVEIGVMAGSQEHADAALAAAFGEIAAIHALMSFHEPASDLGRINASSHSHHDQYLEPGMRDWIGNFYARDFEMFNYSRDLHAAEPT